MTMLSCSERIKQEYCCTVVQIGECFPIEGADRIQRTLVNGQDMVISKEIKPGDIMIYAANETALLPEFLSANNLYGIGDFELNANAAEVEALIREEKKDEAKALCGFFTPQNRVKMLKLRGTYSFGFLFSLDALHNWNPKTKEIQFDKLIGTDFDTIDGTLFVKPYVPNLRGGIQRNNGLGKDNSVKYKKERFDRMVEGSFLFHYDTSQLQRNMHKIKPDDIVNISVKMHGTSAIFGKVLCRVPVNLPIWKKLWNKMVGLLNLGWTAYPDFELGQGNVYASRTVLKNRWVDKNAKAATTSTTTDIWGIFNQKLESYIKDNTVIYGEIVGYMPGSSKMVQKGYDYKVPEGEARFMPYRITTKTDDGRDYEWSVSEVNMWTRNMITYFPELKDVLMLVPVVFHGKLKELYPDIPVDEHWHDNVLAAMKADKQTLGMECTEPLCKNKVPREGVVVRIDNDPLLESFKLKCSKFLKKESESMDAGEVDMEMEETYG